MHGNRRWFLAALVCVSLVGVACSSGGRGGGDQAEEDDPLAEAGVNGQFSVSIPAGGGVRLGGTLSVPPDAKGPVPGVVIVPTIGPVNRDGIENPTSPDPIYGDLSRAFVNSGIATLRYDRRGIGASKVSGKEITYDDLVADARDAVKFLTQRKEVGRSAVALVGHDIGGPMVLRVAGSEPGIKSVVLLSSPGRPLVDVLADGFAASHGQASADRFRAIVGQLVSTGSLPGPDAIPPEHQSVLGQGQAKLLQGMFAVDPAAEAAKVKVPALVIVSSQSKTVTRADGDNLVRAMGPAASLLVTDATPTLQAVEVDRPPRAVDPNEVLHGGGQVVDGPAARDQEAVSKVASFLSAKLA